MGKLARSALRDLLGSKKFIGTAAGLIVAGAARYGLDLPPAEVAAFLGAVGVWAISQGIADSGKEAAKVAREPER